MTPDRENQNNIPETAAQTQAPIPKEPEANGLIMKLFYIGMSFVVLLLTIGAIYWLFHGTAKETANSVVTKQPVPAKTEPVNQTQIKGVQLIAGKNYGDKYADGILPIGDGKYQTASPKAGFVYACDGYAQNMQQSQGGAGKRGPWFIGQTQYDINKKLHVQGSVSRSSVFSDVVTGGHREINSNDLPNHPTGVFPISPTDPAYAYDKNPNVIKAQSFSYTLDSTPVYGDPSCIGGQVGVMMTGVALFSGFDAAGRDAGAWEVQDNCDGHPEKEGIYHYHTLSSCIKDATVSTVIGFALDGFPITGPTVGKNNILTTADLDECHGLTSQIVLDGKTVTSYHYVMTQDFPYSVSCFRGKAIQPPGQAVQPAKQGA